MVNGSPLVKPKKEIFKNLIHHKYKQLNVIKYFTYYKQKETSEKGFHLYEIKKGD